MPDAVPKFASFKAKRVQATVPTEKVVPSPPHKYRESHKHTNPSHHGHEREFSSNRHNRSEPRIAQYDKNPIRPRQRGVEAASLAHQPQDYAIDRHGDKTNLQYEATDRYRVPQHRTAGYGRIIGLDRTYRIDRDASSLVGLVVTNARPHSEVAASDGLSGKFIRHNERTLRLVKGPELDQFSDNHSDYIELRHRKRKRSHEGGTAENPRYKAPLTKSDTQNGVADSDLDDASDSDIGDVARDAEIRARDENSRLTQRTRDEPSSLAAWQALIKHQKDMIRPDVADASLSAQEQKTLAQLRLSLYHTAERLVCDADRKHLVLGRMKEGASIWRADKTSQEWQAVLEQDPENHALWIYYIDLVQTRQRDFRYGDVLAQLQDCLTRLQRAASLTTSNTIHATLALIQLHVVLRITKFQHQCGYTELSIAVWQALLQLYVMDSADMSNAEVQSATLNRLSDSWDMEEPRFGDKEASGGSTMELSKAVGTESPRDTASAALADVVATSIFELPGYTAVEDGASEDPFHTIFASDINPLLTSLQSSFTFEAVIDAWLCFHGLVPIPGSSPYPWRDDVLLGQSALEGDLGLDPDHSAPMNHSQTTTASLFSETLTVFPSASTISAARVNHINRGLAQLIETHTQHTSLIIYHLAFQAYYFPAIAHKTARTRIKAQPANLALYNAAALIEAKMCRLEKAVQIWQTSQSMSADLNKSIVLIHSWARFELARNDTEAALRVLTRLDANTATGAPETLPPAARLRIVRTLDDAYDVALHSSDPLEAALYGEVCMLLAYLSTDHNILEANKACDRYISILDASGLANDNRTMLQELLSQSKAEMIDLHITTNKPYRARELLDSLAPAMAAFPDNTKLLGTTARLRLRGVMAIFDLREGIRASMQTPADDASGASLPRWTMTLTQAIWRFNKLRSLGAGPAPDGVRALFSRSVLGSDSSGGPMRHAPSIWAMWFSFEHGLVKLKRAALAREEQVVGTTKKKKTSFAKRELDKAAAQLKMVLVHGVRFLPWCKDWIMRGIIALDGCDAAGLSRDESRRLWNVLVEREMRLRVELGDDA